MRVIFLLDMNVPRRLGELLTSAGHTCWHAVAIGMAAAFGLLLLIMVLIQVMGLAISYQSRRTSMRVAAAAAESRDKALAAVIAVSALLERDGDSGARSTG